MIVFGMRHYGRVDAIEGLGDVRTRFAHIWFLPLLPLGSVFVTGETARGVRGVPVPLSLKSIAAAYARTWVVLSTLGMLAGAAMGALGMLGAVVEMTEGVDAGGVRALLATTAMGGASCFGLVFNIAIWWAMGRFWGTAGPARRAELLAHLGFEPAPPQPAEAPAAEAAADPAPSVEPA